MSHAATWAIVPVKSLAQAKQRLAGILPLEARRRLMLIMLDDVLATLRQVERLGPVLVVTPDAEVAEFAANAGASVLREAAGQGHSAAAIAGFTYAQSHGAVRALTLPADAPLVTAAELRSLIESAEATAGPHLTLVPSHDGDGTNGFLVVAARPPAAELRAGKLRPASSRMRQRGTSNAACSICPAWRLDIDEPRDLARLIAQKRGDRALRFSRAQPHLRWQ